MSGARVAALVRKELEDLRRNRAVLLPVLLTSLVAVALPLFIAIALPALTGDSMADDEDVRRALETVRPLDPRLAALDTVAAVQAFVVRRFLLFLLLVPISGAMTIAAHSIVGEKQTRALEPLLATPLTTAELLTGKVLGALLPALGVSGFTYLALLGGVAGFARPGVPAAVFNLNALLLVALVGPLAALVSLQLTVLVSARARDPRAAQQAGVLLILPLTGLFVAEMSGTLCLTPGLTLALAAGLAGAWLVLLAVSVAAFDREAILTKWK